MNLGEELIRTIEEEAKRLANMEGTMEEKEQSMYSESFPIIMNLLKEDG